MRSFFSALWRLGIYVLLIVILYIVIIYKVKYEGIEDPAKYLYFYKCSGNICTTSETITNYLSKYECDKTCPIVIEFQENSKVELQHNNSIFTYNYEKGEIINEE